MPSSPIAILGTGSYTPPTIMTNDEISRLVDTTDEWIRTRTGITQRRIAGENEATSDLATRAGQAAIADAGLTPADIDLIIVATLSPDSPMPACATIVQAKLGVRPGVPCFDLNAACTGFIYALDTAWAMLTSGRYRCALVIGAEKLSGYIDWQDRSTCVLFGDAAGAAVLGTPPKDSSAAILGAKLYCHGGVAELLHISAGGSAQPTSQTTLTDRGHYIKMKGREVFKLAVREMEHACHEILEQQGLTIDQIACVIPHQANQRIIDAISKSLQLPLDRFFLNLDRYGNTSAASIPLALDEARRAGRIQPGDITLLVAFGAGLTYGAALVRW